MRETLHQVLPYVNGPSKYLGTEKNRYYKPLSEIETHILLAFPDLYEIAMSYFGSQILYDILNKQPHIYAEQVFTPAPDFEKELRKKEAPLWSLETRTPANQFDIIGFSLLYELNYTNILTMLSLAKIPFLAKERTQSDPIIIAGGPCAFNPEPVADLFDAIVIGDGELVIVEMMTLFSHWKREKNASKTELLRRWAKIKGVYIPSFFEPEYDENGSFTRITPLYPEYKRVQRAIAPDLNALPFPNAPVVPYAEPVHNRLRIEVSRGCTRGCRFCQAGMIYRPVRERSRAVISQIAKELYSHTGMDELSLLSLSVGDYSELVPLLQDVNRALDGCTVSLSFPSIRAEAITEELMKEVKAVRKTGFTIAPEAGTDRLRRVINKSMTTQDIEAAVETAFQLGWKIVKLYFMIGLPTETDSDLEETLRLLDRLSRVKKGTRIHASFACFIPKPHTPFQWAKQATLQQATEKINYFKRNLPRQINMKWQDPKVSVVEGLFSRGDRKMVHTLLRAWENGCRLDGWSDYFNYDLWEKAFIETHVDPDAVFTKEVHCSDPLPWDHIYTGVTKPFLQKEWQNAQEEMATPDCRKGECSRCGVCDFTEIAPKLHVTDSSHPALSSTTTVRNDTQEPQKLTIIYEKKGEARFLGHLELMQLFLRAFRRISVSFTYSNGFHPHPKIQFDDPLPLGMESLGEFFNIEVLTDLLLEEIQKKLNHEMPHGLRIVGVEPYCSTNERAHSDRYRVQLFQRSISSDEMNAFITGEPVLYRWKTGKGMEKTLQVQDMISAISVVSENEIEMELWRKEGKKIRPLDVLKTAFAFDEQALAETIVCKI